MWPFKKKKLKEKTENDLLFEQYSFCAEPMDILNNNANPFFLYKGSYTQDNGQHYYMGVYNFRNSQLERIDNCVQSILGITDKEFLRIMKEHYQFRANEYQGLFFTIEEISRAINLMEEFKPYYENYHVPKALMERLSCYSEGGFPPPPHMTEKASKRESLDTEVTLANVIDLKGKRA